MNGIRYQWMIRLAAGMVAITMSFAVIAHGSTGDLPENCPPMPRAGNPMPPAGMFPDAPRPGAMPPFLHDIDLNELQQDKLFTLMHGQAPSIREQLRTAAQAIEELHRLAVSGHFTIEKARVLAEIHAKALSQVVLMHAELDAKVLKLLTPEQRKQLDDAGVRYESRSHFKRL